jgi:hypothetical protein
VIKGEGTEHSSPYALRAKGTVVSIKSSNHEIVIQSSSNRQIVTVFRLGESFLELLQLLSRITLLLLEGSNVEKEISRF